MCVGEPLNAFVARIPLSDSDPFVHRLAAEESTGTTGANLGINGIYPN